MMYVWAFLLGGLSGACGLGFGGLFVTLFIIALWRWMKKWEAYADQQMSYRSAYEHELDQHFLWLREAAEMEDQRERQRERAARRARLQGAENAVFRVIK